VIRVAHAYAATRGGSRNAMERDQSEDSICQLPFVAGAKPGESKKRKLHSEIIFLPRLPTNNFWVFFIRRPPGEAALNRFVSLEWFSLFHKQKLGQTISHIIQLLTVAKQRNIDWLQILAQAKLRYIFLQPLRNGTVLFKDEKSTADDDVWAAIFMLALVFPFSPRLWRLIKKLSGHTRVSIPTAQKEWYIITPQGKFLLMMDAVNARPNNSTNTVHPPVALINSPSSTRAEEASIARQVPGQIRSRAGPM